MFRFLPHDLRESSPARPIEPVLDSEREAENIISLTLLLRRSLERLRERLPSLEEPELSWVARENLRSMLQQVATQINSIITRSPLFRSARAESEAWLHSLREVTRATLEKQEGLTELRRVADEMLSRAEQILTAHLPAEYMDEHREQKPTSPAPATPATPARKSRGKA